MDTAYYADLRKRINAYCDKHFMVRAQFARLAGVRADTLHAFMNHDSPTCKLETAALYEEALKHSEFLTCNKCKTVLNINHFALKPDQRDGECVACYRKRIRGCEKQRRMKESRVKPTEPVVEPTRSYKGREVDSCVNIQPSTVAGINQDKLWFENFFGVALVPGKHGPARHSLPTLVHVERRTAQRRRVAE
jgi:hypothetical protein